jgi:adhesin transport system outer membrane protein
MKTENFKALARRLAFGASCAVLLSLAGQASAATQQPQVAGQPRPPADMAAAIDPSSSSVAGNIQEAQASPAPASSSPGADALLNARATTGNNNAGNSDVTVTNNAAPAATTPAPDAPVNAKAAPVVAATMSAPSAAAIAPSAGGGDALAPAMAAPVTEETKHGPVATPADANDPMKITLTEAVGKGIRTNPEYGVVANNRRATDEELRQARALWLPSIDLHADTGFEHTDNPVTRADPTKNTENLWRYNGSLTLTQLLFDGFQTKYENLRQEARVLSASHRVREAAELNGLAVVEAYLEVLRQREILNIARDNVSQHLTLMGQINDSANAGRTTRADAEQAKARVASARAGESDTRQALRSAEADYITRVGDEPKDLVMPSTPQDKLESDVEKELQISLAQSPTLDIYKADWKVAHQEYEGSKSTLYPKVNFQLNGSDGHDLNGLQGRDTEGRALVVLDWNLYRGGGDNARVREFIDREAQAKEQRAKAARDLEDDVRQTWARMVSAGERARQFETQADANVEVVKAYKDQFDLGRRTLLDVLDSQNELFVSRSNAVNAKYLEIFAIYRLLALKGELLKTLGVAYPREADPANM